MWGSKFRPQGDRAWLLWNYTSRFPNTARLLLVGTWYDRVTILFEILPTKRAWNGVWSSSGVLPLPPPPSSPLLSPPSHALSPPPPPTLQMYGHYSELQQFAREFAASRTRSQQARQEQQPPDAEEARKRKSKAWSEFSPIPSFSFPGSHLS